MSLANNIKEARTKKGITQDELAKLVGKTKNVISNWERGENKPDADVIFELCDILNVDANYLLGWENNQNLSLSLKEQDLIKKYRSLSDYDKGTVDIMIDRLCIKEDEIEYMSIPYYGHIASAGTGQYLFDDIPFEMKKIIKDIYNQEADFAIGVNGDSMEPEYHDGDIVLIKKMESIPNGIVGLFIHNGEAFMKKHSDRIFTNGTNVWCEPELVSTNTNYPPIKCNEETKCIGKVIGKAIVID